MRETGDLLAIAEGALPSLSLFFICTVWIPAAVSSVLLITNVPSWWIPAAVTSAVLLILLWLFLFRALAARASLLLASGVIVVTSIAAAAAIYLYDLSWDGRWYHADAILALLHGVNPVYRQIPAVKPIFSNHYPKGTWYFSALTIHTFHSYQLGKVYNWFLIFACFAYGHSFFRQYGLGRKYSFLLATVTALSPVACSQVTTYYVDGAMSSLLAITVMSSVAILFKPRELDRTIFTLAASLTIAIKFTGCAYIAAVVCVLSGARMLKGATRALAFDAVGFTAVLLLGVLVLGYDPYITNMRRGHSPFYPILGPHGVDTLEGNTPPELRGHSYNLFQKFSISFFSPTAEMESDRVGKIPFTVSKRELSSVIFPDDRLAGWGVFFSGVTLSSLAIFLVGRGWRGNDPVIVALVIIAATIFINPDCWWARFTPQVAFVPIFFLLPGLKSESDVLRRCALVVCALLVINNLLFLAGSVRACFVNSQALNRSFIALSQAKGEGEYWAYRSDKMYFHYEQFSGLKGIVICGELDPPRDPLPQSGFPLGTNRPFALLQPTMGHILPGQDQYDGPEVILFKGQCSSKPPL